MLTIRIPQTREIEIETFFDDHDLLRRALGESSIGWVCPWIQSSVTRPGQFRYDALSPIYVRPKADKWPALSAARSK